ncbi:MAG: topoisomerase IV, partial [Angelakisella sp.]
GSMLFVFENGKAGRVELASYETKTKRKKLTGAYNIQSPLVFTTLLTEEKEYLFASSAQRMLIVNTAMIAEKTTRGTQGVQVMTMKKGVRLVSVCDYVEGTVENPHRLRTKNLPATGAIVRDTQLGEQLML